MLRGSGERGGKGGGGSGGEREAIESSVARPRHAGCHGNTASRDDKRRSGESAKITSVNFASYSYSDLLLHIFLFI